MLLSLGGKRRLATIYWLVPRVPANRRCGLTSRFRFYCDRFQNLNIKKPKTNMIRQAVVVAGGRGTRLGKLAREHGNKALVPVCGQPILLHTVRWLKESGVKSIIVTVNYVREFKKISALFAGDKSVAVIGNLSRRNSAQCLPLIQGLLDPRYLFVYGHAPIPPEHLEKMENEAGEGVVVSLYRSTTQREETQKFARLDGARVVMDGTGDLFIEPPHILNHEITELLAQTESWKRSFQNYRGPIHGVVSGHPPEFHDQADLNQLCAWMAQHLPAAERASAF